MIASAALAVRNLRRQFRRSTTSLLSIGFGVAALLAATGFNEAMFHEFREATILSQYGHLQITQPGFHEKGRSDPWQYLLPAENGSMAAHLPIGAEIAPRLLTNGLISYGEATVPFMSEAIDPAIDMVDDRSLEILSGRRLQGSDSRHVILGSGLATRLNVPVGANVVMLANTAAEQLSAVEAEVVGIFSSFSSEFDEAALFMPIDLARDLVKVEGAHAWLVFLSDTQDTEVALASLIDADVAAGLEIRPWYDLAEFYTRAVALFTQQLHLVKGIVIAIILLGIGNTMMMNVMERTGEIGTVMALGAKRSEVLQNFLMEGAVLGVVGALIGIIVAFGLGQLLAMLQIEMPPPPSFSRGYMAGIKLSPAMVGEAALIAVATTTIASFYPALRASRMTIVDAIRSAR